MKTKILTLILALALVMSLFTLTACGDSDDDEDEEDDTSTSQSSSKDDEEEEDEEDDYVSSIEISTFNEQFTVYAGDSILGSSVSSLLTSLITNATTNEGVEEKLPTVIFYDSDGEETIADGTGDIDDYKADLTSIKTTMRSAHNYYVDCSSRNSDGYVKEIIITY